MTPTKEQIEKAREDLENLQFFLMKNDPRSGIKDPCDKASITRGQIETILSCLTPPEPAASEGEVAELRRTVAHLEADRKLAVEGLKRLSFAAQTSGGNAGIIDDHLMEQINEAEQIIAKLTASKGV